MIVIKTAVSLLVYLYTKDDLKRIKDGFSLPVCELLKFISFIIQGKAFLWFFRFFK